MRVINLLPKDKQKDLYYRKLEHAIRRLFGFAIACVVLILLFQFATRLYIETQIRSVTKETEEIKALISKDENAKLKAEVTNFNNKIKDYNSLAKDSPKWSPVLTAFARLVPDGVYIQSFSVSLEDKEIKITGYADTRESVILLYNNIANDRENFENIDYPLENVAEPEDVKFHFTFMVKDSLIKS